MFNFKNLRTKSGVLLRYKVYEKTLSITNEIFKKINSDIRYFTNSKILDEKTISFILKKESFGEFSNSNIYTLAAYLINKKFNNLKNKKIKIDYFSYNLLKNSNKDEYKIASLRLKSFLKFKILKLSNFFTFLKNRKIYFYCFDYNKSKKIAIRYQAGLSTNIVNDLFFLSKRIEHKNIILYFESKSELKKLLSNKKDLDYIKRNSFRKYIDFTKEIKVISNNYNTKLTNLEKINSLKTKGIFQDYIKQKIIEYFLEVNLWFNFFYEQNIMINHDFTIEGVSNLIKYNAISKLNGISTSFLRSYPRGQKYLNYHWHYYHVIFILGNDSKKKLMNSYNKFDSLVSLGPLLKLNQNMNNKIKLLVLDSNHGDNNDQNQVILTNDLINFYSQIISFSKDNDIELYIRTKKKLFIDNLNIPNSNINYTVIYNDSSIDKLKNNYNYVISISTFFPGVITDYIANNISCFIYDYSGFSKLDNNAKYNNIIYRDLTKLLNNLKYQVCNRDKKNIITNIKKNLFNPNDDFRGVERLKYYFDSFLNSNKNNSSKNLLFTNNKIKTKWKKCLVFNK